MTYYYCNELDPRTRANDSFDLAFTKVDILFLAKKLCFETVSPSIPIPVQHVVLCASRTNG